MVTLNLGPNGSPAVTALDEPFVPSSGSLTKKKSAITGHVVIKFLYLSPESQVRCVGCMFL